MFSEGNSFGTNSLSNGNSFGECQTALAKGRTMEPFYWKYLNGVQDIL